MPGQPDKGGRWGDLPLVVDNSAWSRAARPQIREEWKHALRGDRLRISPIARLEVLFSARSGEAFDDLSNELAVVRPAPLTANNVPFSRRRPVHIKRREPNIRAMRIAAAHRASNIARCQNRMQPSIDTPGIPASDAMPAGDAGAMQDALRSIWARHRELVGERITLIERAVAALGAGQLDEQLRGEALRAAHMLSGSLGTFGFAGASEAAGALEQELAAPRTEQAPIMQALVGDVRNGLR
jgi:HPt (histidine-containing phosphotransfer) domain-containing protein